MIKTVTINGKKLRNAIYGAGYNYDALSMMVGRGRAYLSNCVAHGKIGERELAEICNYLGADPNYFKASNYGSAYVQINSDMIRKLLDENQLTMTEVSISVGMNKTWLCVSLKNERMRGNKLVELANILKVDADDLMAEPEPMLPVVYDGKLYTKAEVVEIMRTAINTFADHAVDYFAEAIDALEKEDI